MINSVIALRMQQETKLLHSNIATRHMAMKYKRCLTKHEGCKTALNSNITLKMLHETMLQHSNIAKKHMARKYR